MSINTRNNRVAMLWEAGGLALFARNGTQVWIAEKVGPTPFQFKLEEVFSDKVTFTDHLFELRFTEIEGVVFAYVFSDGSIVVPPFEFIGMEYLPSQPW